MSTQKVAQRAPKSACNFATTESNGYVKNRSKLNLLCLLKEL